MRLATNWSLSHSTPPRRQAGSSRGCGSRGGSSSCGDCSSCSRIFLAFSVQLPSGPEKFTSVLLRGFVCPKLCNDAIKCSLSVSLSLPLAPISAFNKLATRRATDATWRVLGDLCSRPSLWAACLHESLSFYLPNLFGLLPRLTSPRLRAY